MCGPVITFETALLALAIALALLERRERIAAHRLVRATFRRISDAAARAGAQSHNHRKDDI